MNPVLDLTSPLGITISLTPEIVLSICAMLVLLVVSWRHQDRRRTAVSPAGSALASLIVDRARRSLWLAMQRFESEGLAVHGRHGRIPLSGRRPWCSCIALASTLLSIGYLEREGSPHPRYYVLLLLGNGRHDVA